MTNHGIRCVEAFFCTLCREVRVELALLLYFCGRYDDAWQELGIAVQATEVEGTLGQRKISAADGATGRMESPLGQLLASANGSGDCKAEDDLELMKILWEKLRLLICFH